MSDTVGVVIAVLIVIGAAVLIWYSNKKAEEKRVSDIRAKQTEWGDEMCNWLIEHRYNLSDPRTQVIMDHYGDWKMGRCQTILEKKVSLDFTEEMVKLAFGEPSDIDQKETTAKDRKFRWVYGTPRRGATYVSFKNGKVTKIKS